MAPRARLIVQSAFLALSLGVFSGLLAQRHVVAAYHALHVFPTLAALPWFTLPPWSFVSLGITGGLLLLSLLFGRFYCGWLCPAGFIQELSRRLGRRLGLAGRAAAGWAPARLLVLALCLGLLARRSSAYLYFDHLASLGRVYGLPHALIAGGPFGANFLLGLAFLAVLAAVPLRQPRWFCAALCPSGALFMLLRTAAPGRMRGLGCGSDCGRCAEACPALCIDRGRIDGELCVDCLECGGLCSDGALGYSFQSPLRVLPPDLPAGGLSRKGFLTSIAAVVSGWASAPWLKRSLLGIGPAAAVVPPGGKAYASFLERCVGCDTCVSVCPSKVLVPAGRELGLGGLAKVKLDYGVSYCAYECNACLAVCPSGAISYFPLAAKKRIKIGKSRLIKKLCIPFEFGRDCGACQEQCPTGALSMEPYKGTYAPVQHEEYCIGCGACQFACPTRPRKAIVVDPIEDHAFASPPRRGSKIDCRACASGKGGQACWRCRPAAEEPGGFPF